MNFMGIGSLELLLIFILAFLFFGPEKLPGMAAKAGELYRSFKRTTSGLSKAITEELPTDTKTKDGKKATPASSSGEKVNER